MKPTLKFTTIFLASVLVMLCSLCTASVAQEFSAEMVNTENGSQHPAKIYFSKNKMRVDPEEKGPYNGAVIVDFDTQVMDVLIPSRQMYMENKSGNGPRQQWFQFFQAINVEDACPEWRKMANEKGGSCQKIGDDTVNGRPSVKYEIVSAEGRKDEVWIDKKIKFPSKWQSGDNSGELRNIQEGAQPADLFAIPSGYKKMDMGNMMGRMPSH